MQDAFSLQSLVESFLFSEKERRGNCTDNELQRPGFGENAEIEVHEENRGDFAEKVGAIKVGTLRYSKWTEKKELTNMFPARWMRPREWPLSRKCIKMRILLLMYVCGKKLFWLLGGKVWRMCSEPRNGRFVPVRHVSGCICHRLCWLPVW